MLCVGVRNSYFVHGFTTKMSWMFRPNMVPFCAFIGLESAFKFSIGFCAHLR